MKLTGRVWKFGDHLRSTYFLAAKYDVLGRAGKFEELAQHVLEDVDPAFVQQVRRGDILVVGSAFGTGKHLDGPINALKCLGIAAVLGKGFSAGWERDSINLGLPALAMPQLYDRVETGDVLALDLRSGEAKNLTRGTSSMGAAVDEGLLALIEAGGIAPYTAKRLGIVDRPKGGGASH